MTCDSRHLAKSVISAWLLEETSGNLSAYELQDPNTVLNVSLKSLGILAGVPHVEAVVEHFDCSVEWHLTEGTTTTVENQKVATIYGAPSDLVRCEPLVKNILSRSSSIATYAKRLKDLLSKLSWKGELVSPFVNTPGFALVEENAVFAAGVPSSRKPSSFVLPSCHVGAAGGIGQAINSIKNKVGSNASITLECNTYELALAGAKNGANCIRFFDLNAKDLEKYSKLLKAVKSSLIIEASVDLVESNLKEFALPNVDVLTTPKLFNGCPQVDVVLQYEVLKDPEQIQKRRAASSLQKSTDNNGSAEVINVAGPKEIPTKRHKADSSPTTSAAFQPASRSRISPTSTKKSGSNFNRPGNRSHSSTPTINRNQHHQQTHDSRRIIPSFRSTYGLINASPSSIEGAEVNRSLQQQQQQAANVFLHQARMMTLLGQQQQQGHQSLMGQGQQQQQPWQSIMGGPPPQPSYGGVCRNCGTQYLQGQSYCNNCRAPLH